MNNKKIQENIMRAIKTIMSTKIQSLVTLVALLMFAGFCSAQQGASLSQVLHSPLPGGVVQINVVSNVPLSEPSSFSTDNPARIALDFLGAKRGFSSNTISVNTGKVQSIVGVETPDRTRVIINLTDSARYEVFPASNGYAIKVYNDRKLSDSVIAPKPFARQPGVAAATTITNIDFRRSPNGGGSLIVDMSNDEATVDTQEKNGNIIVDILNVNIPGDLERRLDVADFATPVQSIDSFQNSNNVRMVVVPTGNQQNISFQSGNRFTLTVDPVVDSEESNLNPEDVELGYVGERLSINFQNIDIRSALTVIADFTGINFVTSDAVQGEITINLKDVPWDHALDVIMTSKGLAKRQTGNVIWVAPASEIAEVEAAEIAAQELLLEKAPLVSEVIRINYANAVELTEVIREVNDSESNGGNSGQSTNSAEVDSLLSPRGSVTVDARTNSILVQDVAPRIADLKELIAELDQPVRQVLIETRIVEANDDFSKELGARLGFQPIIGRGSGTVRGSGTIEGLSEDLIANGADVGASGLEFDTGGDGIGGLSVDLGANGILDNPAGSFAFDLFRTGSSFAGLISLELSALEADGRGKIVASPKLLTTNQQEASISQGIEVFVTIPGEGGGIGAGGGLEVIEAELQLTVTPQITPDDRVILDVEINQDAVVGPTAAQTISTTQIQTQIIADNGETVVIGGIYSEEFDETVTKIPVLGDIPYIRHLFRQKSVQRDRSELLIFLTPKIITPKLNLG